MGNGRDYLFTSESVTEGHPDKIADQISDGILDAIIATGQDRACCLRMSCNYGDGICCRRNYNKLLCAYP